MSSLLETSKLRFPKVKRAHISGNIEELKREADDVVTQIRSSTDAEENKRRIEEERQRDERWALA